MRVAPRDALIVLLAGAVAVLAVAVTQKSDRTAVSKTTLEPVSVAASPSVAPEAATPTLVFLGDFTDGSNEGGEGDRNWTSLIGQQINASTPVRVVADSSGGGAGYVVRGSSPTFADQVRRLVTADARVVVVSGSRSDVVASPVDVTAEALKTFALVHELAPRANLIVVGPTWGANEPSEQVLRIRDAVRDAAAVSLGFFVDPIQDGWFTSGLPGLIGADSVHPTDAGNAHIAELMEPIVAAAFMQTR